ncbi:hypothetical protein Anas_08353 [Armadillidium nasatum]|uniref:UPAR/Ly6 domain-containing protein n=1 Tax=Armadillidium nasatum TaxID=96803 RepID=A0A5N5TEG8_9CRUS|nr:hypothetical protein Anas_08353 [Armadillidium nasatum]
MEKVFAMKSVILLLAFLPAGHSLGCFNLYECKTCNVTRTKCSMIEDICVTYNNSNSIESRCGTSKECSKGPSMIDMFQKFMKDEIHFSSLFGQVNNRSNYLQCCEEDYCNDYLIQETSELNGDGGLISAETNATIPKISTNFSDLNLMYFAPNLKNISNTDKSSFLLNRKERNEVSSEIEITSEIRSETKSSLVSNKKKNLLIKEIYSEIKSNPVLNWNERNKVLSDVETNSQVTSEIDVSNFTEVTNIDENFTTSVEDISIGNLTGGSNHFWSFLSHELLILITLSNLWMFLSCFI